MIHPIKVPSYFVTYTKGLVTGMFIVIFALALNWGIKNWKAIQIVVANPEAVATLKFETVYAVKK